MSCCSGDVPGGDRRDPGRDRAVPVHPDPRAALQTDRGLYLQPSLPGKRQPSRWVAMRERSRFRWLTSIQGIDTTVVSGSGAGSLLLEQRVHPQSDRGELSSHPAAGVRHALQSLQGTLEPVSGSCMDTNTHIECTLTPNP